MNFDDFTECVFNAPIYAWAGDFDDPWLADMPADGMIELVRTLLSAPGRHLAPYPDAQVAQGLDILFNPAVHGCGVAPLIPPRGEAEERLAAIWGFSNLFEQVFAPRCTPAPLHGLRRAGDDAGYRPLNIVCYMWWETCPFFVGDESYSMVERRAMLGAMERTLASPNVACQEAALHGLGHAYGYAPQAVEAAIDAFLARLGSALPPEIVTYAQRARKGCVE